MVLNVQVLSGIVENERVVTKGYQIKLSSASGAWPAQWTRTLKNLTYAK